LSEPWVKFQYRGDTHVRAPGSTLTVTYPQSGSTYYKDARKGVGSGGYWSVRAEIDLNTTYTTSYCSPP